MVYYPARKGRDNGGKIHTDLDSSVDVMIRVHSHTSHLRKEVPKKEASCSCHPYLHQQGGRKVTGTENNWGLPWWLTGKEPVCHAGDVGSIPGSGKSPGEGNGNPLQYSSLRNHRDRGAWGATVHGVAKSWTWLSTGQHTQCSTEKHHKTKLVWQRWCRPQPLKLEALTQGQDGYFSPAVAKGTPRGHIRN